MQQNLMRTAVRRRRAIASIASLVAGFSVPMRSSAQAQRPLKVGFVYVSPIGEAGWTYQHEQGRLEMQRALGASVQSTFVEGVAEGADAERVIRELAASGHGLIFATSFGYLEATLRVAAEHPDVRFEHAGGYKTAPNVNTYDARWYEARYLAGLLAGRTSRSGVAGYVAGFPVPEVVQGIDAFALGMREARRDARVRVIWLNAWFDPPREREAAMALVGQGADVLTNHSASSAVAQAAQESFRTRGTRFIAYQSDMRKFAPDAQLAAVTQHWGGYYTRVARSVQGGSWKPQPVWGGIGDGFMQVEAIAADVPPATRALLEERRAALIAGRVKPFSAPLVDNAGKMRLASGALDAAAIRHLDWLVEGVIGAPPSAR